MAKRTGVDALREARERKQAQDEESMGLLYQMPIPSGCSMTVYRCKDCKLLGAWVYLNSDVHVGYFYDPCRCMLDQSMGKPGKGYKSIAHLP